MSTFNVGDRVVIKPGEPYLLGKCGAVLEVDGETDVLVEFDEYIDGHSGGGVGKAGHCWYVKVTNCEHVQQRGSKEDLLKMLEV